MMLHVHFAHPLAPAEQAHLESLLLPEITLTAGAEPPEPAAYNILVAGRPTRAQLAASPQLRVLIIPWAGLPPETSALMRDFPHVAVHNLHHNALPVAEMVIALLLAAAKAIVPMDRALRAHDWTPRYGPNPAILLHGRRALILGYGAIGRHVARLCQGLGMTVTATRRTLAAPTTEDGVALHPAEALPSLLPAADALLICLPLTSETEGLIGAAELALLPPHAMLVNVGRGPIVDQAALYAALKSGALHAAGLDVWYNYPVRQGEADPRAHTPPADYPFHELDNVVMSPHRAGGLGTAETEDFRMEQLAALCNAAAHGEPLPNRVDLDAGY